MGTGEHEWAKYTPLTRNQPRLALGKGSVLLGKGSGHVAGSLSLPGMALPLPNTSLGWLWVKGVPFSHFPKSRSLVILLKQGFTKFFTFTKGFY